MKNVPPRLTKFFSNKDQFGHRNRFAVAAEIDSDNLDVYRKAYICFAHDDGSVHLVIDRYTYFESFEIPKTSGDLEIYHACKYILECLHDNKPIEPTVLYRR